jgi:hypothetical protein
MKCYNGIISMRLQIILCAIIYINNMLDVGQPVHHAPLLELAQGVEVEVAVSFVPQPRAVTSGAARQSGHTIFTRNRYSRFVERWTRAINRPLSSRI